MILMQPSETIKTDLKLRWVAQSGSGVTKIESTFSVIVLGKEFMLLLSSWCSHVSGLENLDVLTVKISE